MRNYICGLIFAFIYSANPVLGQSSQNEFELKDTVIVVADRYSIPLKHETNTRSFYNESFVKEFTSHSAIQLLDAFVPSTFIFEKKIAGYGVGTDGGGAIQMRGLGGKPNTGVLVLINGHPDFMGIFGPPLPDVYGDEIESVEVLSGPSSTVFGSNALGGVINLKTGIDYRKLLKVGFEGGSFGTYGVKLGLNKKLGATGFSFSLNRKSSEGHIEKTSFHSTQLNGSIEQRVNDIWSLSANIRYVPYRFDDPARKNDVANIGTYGIIERTMGDIIIQNSAGELKGSTQFYMNSGKHRFYDGFESKDFTYGASVYEQYILSEKFNIAAGGDLIHYGGEQLNTNKKYDLTTYGVYALGVFTPVNNVSLRAGLRFQHHSLGINKVSPTFGISYSPHYTLKIFANYQTGFRIPTIRDLYLFPVSNENLTEEEVNSIELGFEYLLSAEASIKLSAYRNDVKNIILPVANNNPPPLVKYQNSGNAIQNGLELSSGYKIGEWGFSQISYSFLDSGNLTAFNPKHQIKYMIGTNWNNLQAALFGKYIKDLFTENGSKTKLPDYHVINASISYNLWGYRVFAKVFNIFNKAYNILPDYPAPGRYFIAGFDFSI